MSRPSDRVLKGDACAPQRSLFYALGLTQEELERPLIAVVSAHSEIVPGHLHLDKITDAVKAGIRMAGGTPIMVPAIGVCDGIAMGHIGMKYSLASRELIADSVETMLNAHGFDGAVLVPNCDKIVPGMLMGALRVNIPAVVMSGGAMLPGNDRGKDMSLSTMFEAVGAKKAGLIDQDELTYIEQNACPGCGSCSGMFTANSMNCLCEVLGIALPGNGTIPAVYSGRMQLAKTSRHGRDGHGGEGHPAARHRQRTGAAQRSGLRYGAWLLIQYRAASACHRKGSAGRARPQRHQ